MALPQATGSGASPVTATGLWLQPRTTKEHISHLFACSRRIPDLQEVIRCPE